MIEAVRGRVLISYNPWFINLDKVYLGQGMIKNYKELGERIAWIENPKMRLYIHVRLIKGDSFRDAMNKISSKKYLTDPIYRKINHN